MFSTVLEPNYCTKLSCIYAFDARLLRTVLILLCVFCIYKSYVCAAQK